MGTVPGGGGVSVEFRPARRENLPLLLGVMGGTGSGKTYSAMRLSRGIAAHLGQERFALIDTENRRGLHYADEFAFDHADLKPPFRPSAYANAIETAASKGYGVILVDSMSHEWAGDGGCLDWHEEEMQGKPERKMTAWIKPKTEHRKMMTRLLTVPAHVILCFRAEQKVEMVKNGDKWEVIPKRSLTGLDGWIPICEKRLPFELTASFLLTADEPGVPKPIKLEAQHRPFVALDKPLDEQVGRALAEWAAGGTVAAPATDELVMELLGIVPDPDAVLKAVEEARASKSATQFAQWLERQLKRAREARVPA